MSMNRVVVIGQQQTPGQLSCLEFARMLSMRLGLRHLALGQDAPAEVQAALHAHDQWIASEPAGRFTEAAFRHADTVVWLHFSPLDYARDWLARAGDLLRRRGHEVAARVERATWHDLRASFETLMQAPAMYRMLGHPALAHLRVHELRDRRRAEFWLMSQRRRSGLRPSASVSAAASAIERGAQQ